MSRQGKKNLVVKATSDKTVSVNGFC